MNYKTIVLGGIALAVAAPAWAHHSFAMFDNGKTVTLNGTVEELEWTNPHGWLHVVAAGADGKQQKWALEMVSVRELQAGGWTKTSVKPGDKITVTLHPLKDGTRGGQFMGGTLANGTALSHGGAVEKSRVPPGQS